MVYNAALYSSPHSSQVWFSSAIRANSPFQTISHFQHWWLLKFSISVWYRSFFWGRFGSPPEAIEKDATVAWCLASQQRQTPRLQLLFWRQGKMVSVCSIVSSFGFLHIHRMPIRTLLNWCHTCQRLPRYSLLLVGGNHHCRVLLVRLVLY